MIVSLTRWVLGHRLLVVAGWLALAVAGAAAASSLGGALSQQFSMPALPARLLRIQPSSPPGEQQAATVTATHKTPPAFAADP